MSNANLGHLLCPFTNDLAIVRANKKGKLYFVSRAGMITPSCEAGQVWIIKHMEKWPEPDRPPEHIKLEYDYESRAPRPVYVNEAVKLEAPKPEPVNEKSGFSFKKMWEGE